MERTRRSTVEDRTFDYLAKIQGRVVEGVGRLAETVDTWWPEATSRFTERIPAYVDRGARLAERELDHEYKLAKRVIKNQRVFLKDVTKAMALHAPARPAGKAPVKAAA